MNTVIMSLGCSTMIELYIEMLYYMSSLIFGYMQTLISLRWRSTAEWSICSESVWILKFSWKLLSVMLKPCSKRLPIDWNMMKTFYAKPLNTLGNANSPDSDHNVQSAWLGTTAVFNLHTWMGLWRPHCSHTSQKDQLLSAENSMRDRFNHLFYQVWKSHGYETEQ